MPLVTPGMPCISVTLLLVKYSSHVALRDSESQKDLHSLVVIVSLSISMTFAHTSYPLERRVRFPRRQTLRRMSTQASLSQLFLSFDITNDCQRDDGVGISARGRFNSATRNIDSQLRHLSAALGQCSFLTNIQEEIVTHKDMQII